MNNYPALIGVVKRLPHRLREEWKRKVAKIIDKTNREPLFQHLVDLAEKECKVVNTTFSKRMDEIPTQKGKKDVYRVKTSSHAITKTYPGKVIELKDCYFLESRAQPKNVHAANDSTFWQTVTNSRQNLFVIKYD